MERCNTEVELLKIDIKNQENQLLLNKIDFGASAIMQIIFAVGCNNLIANLTLKDICLV